MEKNQVENKVRCYYFDEGSLQVIDVKGLKIKTDPMRLTYIYESRGLKVYLHTVGSKG